MTIFQQRNVSREGSINKVGVGLSTNQYSHDSKNDTFHDFLKILTHGPHTCTSGPKNQLYVGL